MSDYKGLKIPEKIIIVEKPIVKTNWGEPRKIPQGYVVPFGDKKMLESAHTWADHQKYRWVEELKRSVDDGIEYGIEHVYENGKFKMTVKESAAGSWQGGKLSFWTCELEAPDGKKYDIGINSDYLCETIMHNTLINGVVQGDVYLGKVKGNTMAVTKHQPSYVQAVHDESKRQEKQSAKYNIGDVVKTLTSAEIYAGTWYELWELEREIEDKCWGWLGHPQRRKADYTLKIYNTPKERHIFLPIVTNPKTNEQEIEKSIEVKSTKPKRIITGKNRSTEIVDLYPTVLQSLRDRDAKTDWNCWDDWNKYYSIHPHIGVSNYTSVGLRYSPDPDGKPYISEVIGEIKKDIDTWECDATIKIVDESGNILDTITYAGKKSN